MSRDKRTHLYIIRPQSYLKYILKIYSESFDEVNEVTVPHPETEFQKVIIFLLLKF